MKKLVAYFSVSGTTKLLAQKLAKVKNADLFEIIPEIPYSNEDLNWNNPKSRSSLEMNDKNSRPRIVSKINNIEEYDIIYVGFPIWWYQAPTIINTFLESYTLNDKIIVPFATSGGSQMGKTNQYLSVSCKGAKLIEGKVLSPYSSDEILEKL